MALIEEAVVPPLAIAANAVIEAAELPI